MLECQALLFCPPCGQKSVREGVIFLIKTPRIRRLSVIHEHLMFEIIYLCMIIVSRDAG